MSQSDSQERTAALAEVGVVFLSNPPRLIVYSRRLWRRSGVALLAQVVVVDRVSYVSVRKNDISWW